MRSALCIVACLVLATSAHAAAPIGPVAGDHAAQMARGLELFKTSVRQVLIEACVKCHGGEKTKGDFDLTSREALLSGGHSGPAVTLGQGEASYMLKLLRHAEDPHMPSKAPKLPEETVAMIAVWVDLGAPYDKPLVDRPGGAKRAMVVTDEDRQFWAFRPLEPVKAPRVAQDSWCRTAVDRFIAARLEEKGLTPNKIAERRTLIRRAYLDLLGVPPTPQELDRFLADGAGDAYERLIDRLLDDPRFGERWARHWLDIARFGESHGFEHDYDRPYAYHFRDFVIRAFNDDMPYDRFVRWQLAGDELAPAEPMALMATGFLGAGVFPTQITRNEVERTRYDAMDDMLATTTSAMLGLTVGCARCHDHKYDPVPAADYYRMVSAFTTTVRSEVELEFDARSYEQARVAWDQRRAPLIAARQRHEQTALARGFDRWLDTAAADAPPAAPWQVLEVVSAKSPKKSTLTPLEDLSVLVSGENPAQDTYTLVAHTRQKRITAVRLEALTHHTLPHGGPGRAGNGNFALTDFKADAAPLGGKPAKPTPVKLIDARATHQQNTGELSVAGSIDAYFSTGWAVDLGGIGKDQAAVFTFEEPVGFDGGTALTFTFRFNNNVQHAIGRPRLAVTMEDRPVGFAEPAVAEAVGEALAVLRREGKAGLSTAQRGALMRWFASRDPTWRTLDEAVREHEKLQPQRKLTKVQICSDGRAVAPMRHHTQGADFFEVAHHLTRGDSEQKGEVATLGFLQALDRSGDGGKRWMVRPAAGSKLPMWRSSMANWMTDTQAGAGALLARVIVNRLWRHHLGRGIVATPSDFGLQGAPPTHPELLEHLAAELVAGGWKLKRIHKLIMTSSVYMQSAAADEARWKLDPSNELFWRFEPRRLEGEAIRDAALAVSGLLDTTMYGPGSLDASMTRRSIYFTVKRSQLVAMMMLFDWPEALVSVGRRSSTTVAPQALLALNSQQVRRWAAGLAKRVEPAMRKSPQDAVRLGYALALSRPPRAQELAANVEFIERQAASYSASHPEEAERMALVDFCQVLLGLSEFIYLP